MEIRDYLEHKMGELELKLSSSSIEEQNTIEFQQQALLAATTTFNEVSTFIASSSFPNTESEIFYYKIACPNLLSEIIYRDLYLGFLTTEPQRPNLETTKRICKRRLRNIKEFLTTHHEIICYRASGYTFRDKELFIKDTGRASLLFDELIVALGNPSISANSLIIGRSIAYLRMKAIYKAAYSLKFMPKNTDAFPSRKDTSNLQWTNSKVSLVELAYALHASKCINKGKCDINQIVSALEITFDVKVGNHYDIFADIKQRKNPIQFIEIIKECLIQKIDSCFSALIPFAIQLIMC